MAAPRAICSSTEALLFPLCPLHYGRRFRLSINWLQTCCCTNAKRWRPWENTKLIFSSVSSFHKNVFLYKKGTYFIFRTWERRQETSGRQHRRLSKLSWPGWSETNQKVATAPQTTRCPFSQPPQEQGCLILALSTVSRSTHWKHRYATKEICFGVPMYLP